MRTSRAFGVSMVPVTELRWSSVEPAANTACRVLPQLGTGRLDRDRFDVVGIGITRTGRWIVVDPDAISRLAVTDGKLPELSEDAAEALLIRVSSGSELAV